MSNIKNWILEDETPEVKYRAMTELLCMKKATEIIDCAYTIGQEDCIYSFC